MSATLTTKQVSSLMAVAVTVGIDSNNPDGGLHHDSPDNEIVECIVDIANGSPYNLNIDPSTLGEDVESNLIRAFYDGAYDR